MPSENISENNFIIYIHTFIFILNIQNPETDHSRKFSLENIANFERDRNREIEESVSNNYFKTQNRSFT